MLVSLWRIFLPLLLISSATVVTASSVNRTIDDEKGDSVTGAVPSYSPIGSWSQGSTCSGCYVQLDPSQTFDGTWHDSTHSPGDPEPRVITAQFTGTAVYVYHVLANTVPYATTLTNLTFTLDGKQVGTYVHIPTESTAFQYDVPVYTNNDLSNTDHTIVIEATGDTNSSLILFDYIVYTFTEDDAPPSSSTSSSASAVSKSSSTSNPPSSTQSLEGASSATSLTSQGLSQSSSLAAFTNGQSNSLSLPTSSTLGSSAEASTSPVTSTSQRNAKFPVGPVVGGVVGGIALLLLAILVLCLCYKRRRLARQPPATTSLESKEPEAGVDAAFTAPVSAFGITHNPSKRAAIASRSRIPEEVLPAPSLPTSQDSEPSMYSATYGSGSALTSSLTSSLPRHYESDTSRSLLRRLPDVPISPGHTTSFSVTAEPYTSYPSIPLPVEFPVVDSKPPLSTTTESSHAESPGATSKHSLRMLPVPPIPGDTNIPRAVARTPTSGSGTVTRLRSQVAVLQEEVARLREEQELQRAFDEAPPQYYDEIRS